VTFEETVEALLGDWIRSDWDNGAAMWSALANVQWLLSDDFGYCYSFRSAGALLADIYHRGKPDAAEDPFAYMEFYCSGPYATVCDHIETAMAAAGYTWKELK
jgi:hypothetical protein